MFIFLYMFIINLLEEEKWSLGLLQLFVENNITVTYKCDTEDITLISRT